MAKKLQENREIKVLDVVIDNIKISLLNSHNIILDDEDIYIADMVLYLSTKKVAEIFRTCLHNFSVEYVQPLMGSGVKRAHIGRNKYYCLSEILDRTRKATIMNQTVLEVCKTMAEENKTKTKKKRKRSRK